MEEVLMLVKNLLMIFKDDGSFGVEMIYVG